MDPASRVWPASERRRKQASTPSPPQTPMPGIAPKLELVMRADRAARAYDPRIVQVRAGYNDELRHILIAASDGTFAHDTQPLARLNCYVIARDGSKNSRGGSGGGGRVELSFFEGDKSPEHFAREAARQAILQLERRSRPGRRHGGRFGPRLAWRPAARSRGPRPRSRLQPQEDLSLRRPYWATGGQLQGDGGGQRHNAFATRIPERRRRRLAYTGNRAD